MTKPALLFLLLALSCVVYGQSAPSGKTGSDSYRDNPKFARLIKLQENYLEELYFRSVTLPNELINGKEYIPYFFRSGTVPLLLMNTNRKATLFFREMQFRNLNLQYDTYRDEVIYTDNSRTNNGFYPQIALNKDNIKGFNLYFDYDSMIFRYYRFPAKYSEKMKDGFYEVGYEGRYIFLIKHRSTVYNKEGVDKYEYKPEKYIFTGTEWAKVTSNSSFVRLFGQDEKEISSLIKKSKVKIQRASRAQIVDILKYYDSTFKNSPEPK